MGITSLQYEGQLMDRIAELEARVAELEAAHRNILVHTARLPDAKPRLLHGLLDSCERIARAALAGKEKPAP